MEVPMSAKSELDGTSALAKEKGLYEVEGDRRVAEMHGDPPPPVEMPAWVPPEVDGKPKILD